ncbi:MAG TPA: SAM-dependent methyltransferase [Trebonia sp.]|nr:SAM-dependent methyltransferase [Trebonia sp.]
MDTGFAPAEIDTTRPHPARMYDYYLGGKDNYPADQQAAAEVIKRAPEIRDIARVNRAFLGRAVRYLVREAGIRQFLDIGTGIPTAGNVHEVAGKADATTRVVYVDNDPIVNVHANALLTGGGTTGIVLADLRDPAAILAHPTVRHLIDFGEPVALLLIAILHFIRDDEDPAGIVATLRDALPPGSYLAMSHVTGDFRGEAAASVVDVYKNATSSGNLRSREQVEALFEGWDLLEPGVVQCPLWRPEEPPPVNLDKLWIYGAVGRKSD